MGVRKYKPTSAGRRNSSVNEYSELTTNRPEKTLCKRIKKRGGRNHHGVTTTRFRGGGARRIYRMIDFKRNKDGVPARVATIEYDPNRTARIALVHFADGDKRYILAPNSLKVGDQVMSGEGAPVKPGNALPLRELRRLCQSRNRSTSPAFPGPDLCGHRSFERLGLLIDETQRRPLIDTPDTSA